MKQLLLDIILKNLFKYSPLIVLSVLLIFIGKLALDYKKDADANKKQYEELLGIKEDYKQLSEYTAKLETEYKTRKEIWELAEKSWKDEKKLLEGRVKALASATFTIQSFPTEQGAPDLVTDTQMVQEVQFVDKDGNLGPAVGVVIIEKGTGVTYSKIYDHEIKIESAVLSEKDGRINILARAWYIQRDTSLNGGVGKPDWKDKQFALPITGGSLVIDPTAPFDTRLKNKFRTAPHLNAGVFVGANEVGIISGGRIGVSVWGYGKTDNDLDWKLGDLGFNVSRDYFDLNVIPVQYRIGNLLPLVEDMYLGPGVGISPGGKSVFLSVGTTF